MTEPGVMAKTEVRDGVTIVTITGTFNRRVATADFDKVVAELRCESASKKLVIDLSNIAALDSTGEGEIEGTLADTIAVDGRACIVIDPDRRYLYVALETLVGELGDAATTMDSPHKATSFVQGTS